LAAIFHLRSGKGVVLRIQKSRPAPQDFVRRFRTLWAYGFDSAAQRPPEKSKVGEKEKYFFPSTNSTF